MKKAALCGLFHYIKREAMTRVALIGLFNVPLHARGRVLDGDA
jgi:hypothetical protein